MSFCFGCLVLPHARLIYHSIRRIQSVSTRKELKLHESSERLSAAEKPRRREKRLERIINFSQEMERGDEQEEQWNGDGGEMRNACL